LHASRWGLVFLVIATVALLASPLSSVRVRADSHQGADIATASLSTSSGHAQVHKVLLSEPSTINTLASVGSIALADVFLSDGSNELLLYNGSLNTTTVAQAVVPGGPLTFEITEAAAGGDFFLEFFNLSSGFVFYEEVTPHGVVSTPALPLSPLQQFGLIGSPKILFASTSGIFLAIDPTSLTIQADYSSLIPAGATVAYALPVVERIYIGGSLQVSGGGAVPFYGFIDNLAGTETTLSPAFLTPPAQSGDILWIGAAGGNIYFGGMLAIFQTDPTFFFGSKAGYLFELNPSTGKVTNLSALNPLSKWAVQSIFKVGQTVVMNIASFSLTSTTFSQVSGTFVLTPNHSALHNDTSLTGSDFVALYLESSLSGGLYFVGGLNETTGTAEIVAIPVSLLAL
jgi:hypothetical protein